MGQCDLGFPVFGSRSRPKIWKSDISTGPDAVNASGWPLVISGMPGIGLFLFVQSELRSRAVSGIDGYDGYIGANAAL